MYVFSDSISTGVVDYLHRQSTVHRYIANIWGVTVCHNNNVMLFLSSLSSQHYYVFICLIFVARQRATYADRDIVLLFLSVCLSNADTVSEPMDTSSHILTFWVGASF